ncbi:MAG: LamG domain-containing protein [Planctomycetota bacterium]
MKLQLLVIGVLAASSVSISAQSLLFAHGGADMEVDVAPAPELSPAHGITLEAWMTYDETLVPAGSSRWPTLARMNPTPGQETYMLRVDAGTTGARSIRFMVRTANNGSRSAATTFAAGQFANWTHIAGTYDGSAVKLFLDGVEVASTPATGALVASTDVLRIGNGDVSSPGAEVWSGHIDELRLWPFARTAAEILATRDQELTALPSAAVTFQFNSSLADSSSGLVAGGSGAWSYDASTPALTPEFSSSVDYGQSSSSCRAIGTAIGSLPKIGNAAFQPRALGATPGSSGLFFSSLGLQLPAFTFAGVDILIDPTLIRVTIPVAGANALGVAAASAGIPNDVGLVGRQYFSQFLILDASCGYPDLTTSQGLAITILP